MTSVGSPPRPSAFAVYDFPIQGACAGAAGAGGLLSRHRHRASIRTSSLGGFIILRLTLLPREASLPVSLPLQRCNRLDENEESTTGKIIVIGGITQLWLWLWMWIVWSWSWIDKWHTSRQCSYIHISKTTTVRSGTLPKGLDTFRVRNWIECSRGQWCVMQLDLDSASASNTQRTGVARATATGVAQEGNQDDDS